MAIGFLRSTVLAKLCGCDSLSSPLATDTRIPNTSLLVFIFLVMYTQQYIVDDFIKPQQLNDLKFDTCGDPEGGGGQGVRTSPPRKLQKYIGFLSKIGPDPLKITKLPIKYSMAGR